MHILEKPKNCGKRQKDKKQFFCLFREHRKKLTLRERAHRVTATAVDVTVAGAPDVAVVRAPVRIDGGSVVAAPAFLAVLQAVVRVVLARSRARLHA